LTAWRSLTHCWTVVGLIAAKPPEIPESRKDVNSQMPFVGLGRPGLMQT
jgi:hypothetical protein